MYICAKFILICVSLVYYSIFRVNERWAVSATCCNSKSSSDSKNDPAYTATNDSTQSVSTGGNAESIAKANTGSVDNSQSTDKTKSGTDNSGGKTQSSEDGSIQPIVLNLEESRNNNYNYQLTDTLCIYTAKTGYGFKSVRSCNADFWTAENNKYSTKVEYNHKEKIATIYLDGNNKKVYKKDSSTWKEQTEGDQKTGTGQTGTTATGGQPTSGGGTTGTGIQPSGGTPATN